MKIQINSLAGSLLFEGDFSSFAECLVAAVKKKLNLQDANLRGANLCGANLRGANLCGANLYGANLRGADLQDANLYGANLYGANLCGANLYGANLRGADLQDANLQDANLRGADLRGADLDNKSLLEVTNYTTILPEGDIIGYKKLKDGAIAKLLIPANAKRVGGLIGRKCRAEFAKVIEGNGHSQHDVRLVYKVGEIVKPVEAFNDDPRIECGSGIHFFITKLEAEEY